MHGVPKKDTYSIANTETMNNITTIGKIIALLSFIIGTILFSFFLYFGTGFISVLTGIRFIIVAFIINLIILLGNLLCLFLDLKRSFEYIKTCGIILLNIPIAVLYIYIIISTMSQIRI